MSSKDTLQLIHEMMCDHIVKMFKNPEELKASDLNVIRQFLKDNNIDGLASDDTPLKAVLDTLPEHFWTKQ